MKNPETPSKAPSVGCDIVDVTRLAAPQESFLRGVLTDRERVLYDNSVRPAEFLAGRYAAKESLLKALGGGLALAKLTEIEILPDELGAPVLSFRGRNYPCSISHERGYAIAVVMNL